MVRSAIPFVAVILTASHASAQAESAPTQSASKPNTGQVSITLQAALQAAWERSVVARETSGQRARAVAERAVTAVLWSAPPALEYRRRDDRTSPTGARETELGVVVPMWWPGQRSAQSQRTETSVIQAAALETAERLRLAGQLRELAWEWEQFQADADSTQSQVHSLENLAEDVERRVQAGDLSRADGMAARAEWLTARAQHAEAAQRLREVRARWTVVTGLPNRPLVISNPDALTLAPSTPSDYTHPELVLARSNRELADKALHLMQLSKADAPELSVGMRQDSSARQASAPHSVTIGLRVPFGPQSRNLARMAAAQAAQEIAKTEELRLEERLASESAMGLEVWRAAQGQFEALRQRADLLRERAQLIERSFRAGETALPELLRTLASAAAADAAMLRQRATWGLTRARLEQSLGILP
jgi:cobalt-zinc-cadmium efflux system outer membrane protein